MFKNTFTFLFLAILVTSCGGGGGGSGSSSSPVQSYSYDKTTAEFTSKTWQADSVTRRLRANSNSWTWDYFASYGSDPDGPIEIQFVEGSDYLSINLGHKLSNYSIRLSEIDSSINPLYDPSGNIVAAIAQNNYTDGTLRSFFFFPDYLSTLNIEHTNIGFLDLFLDSGLDRDTFALNYGSKTYPGDMPTSGTASYGIFGEGIWTQYQNSSSGSIFVVRGDGSLTANFTSSRISGSLSFHSSYSYFDFLEYGATSESQIIDAPVFTVNFPETSISGNSFNYDFNNTVTLTSSAGWGYSGDGIAGGSFFGPDGKEISGTFLLTMDDLDQTNLYDWDFVGAFYGTCKNSGC